MNIASSPISPIAISELRHSETLVNFAVNNYKSGLSIEI